MERKKYYSRTSMGRTLWDHENMFEAWVVRANECKSQRQIRRQNSDIVPIFFNMKVYCVFTLESPHRGDSNEFTQYTTFQYEKEKHPKLFQICRYGIFIQGTQDRVRKSRGKRDISVRAIEVLLYIPPPPYLFALLIQLVVKSIRRG